MLPTRLLLLLVFSLVNTAAWATVGGSGQAGQAVLPAIPSRFAGPQDVVTASVAATGHDLHAIQLQIDVPETATETVDFAGASMSWVRMNGEAVRELPGAPEVPRIVRMIMIDGQGNYQFNVGDLEFSTSTLPYPPAPHVPLAEDANALDETVALRAEFYEHNDWYPANVVEVSEPATIRDVRFVLVTINPVQVNPVTREVRTYSHVDVSLQNVGGAGVNELTHVPEYLSPSFKELYRTIPNFEGSSLDALPVMPGRHLYICDPNATVVGLVQTLVDWRRKRGYDAYIATTTQTGTSATSIRTYIQNQFDSGNGALEYVTLVGDPDAAAPHALATGTALDNTYATIGDINPDPVPDIAVGRLPSTGNLNLQTMIENIISYESDPYMAETDWFERAWCAAHTSQVPSNPSTKQYMRQLMLQHGVPTVDFDVFEGGMSTPTLEARLEAGVCVFNDRMSWIGEFNSGQLAGVAVNEQWPFAWVVTCATGTFGGGASLNLYHRMNPAQFIPLNLVLKAGGRYSTYSAADKTAPQFQLPEDRAAPFTRAGLRFAGKEPMLYADLAMEMSVWYERQWRLDDRAYGFANDRRVQPATDLYWLYAGLNYAWTNTGNQFTFGLTAGGSEHADRFSAYRLGGVLPLASEFPLTLPIASALDRSKVRSLKSWSIRVLAR